MIEQLCISEREPLYLWPRRRQNSFVFDRLQFASVEYLPQIMQSLSSRSDLTSGGSLTFWPCMEGRLFRNDN